MIVSVTLLVLSVDLRLGLGVNEYANEGRPPLTPVLPRRASLRYTLRISWSPPDN